VRNGDEEYEVYGLKARDEVFTQIIGYSGLRWQSIWCRYGEAAIIQLIWEGGSA
jgi:hypothetical protein